MSIEEPREGLDGDQLSELIAHLQSDEQLSIESTLESEISFWSWAENHPTLQQMLLPEKISDIVPAILKFLRYMLGLDREPPQFSGVKLPQIPDISPADGDESL